MPFGIKCISSFQRYKSFSPIIHWYRPGQNAAEPHSSNVKPKYIKMWTKLPNSDFGFMNTLDRLVSKAHLACIADLQISPTIIVTSDYSGHQKESLFEVYSFLITGSQGWEEWESARLDLRRDSKIGRRRISFKRLGDSRKRQVLPCFLNASDHLAGLCVTIIIRRSIISLFRRNGFLNFDEPELSQYAHFRSHVFERLMRVVHFVSFFLGGLTRPGQNVLWFTDQDAIAANDQRIVELTEIWSRVFGHYLQHDLRHIRCGTTRCDNGTLQIEDLASIPDLAAGALSEMVNRYAKESGTPGIPLIIPFPKELVLKVRLYVDGSLMDTGVSTDWSIWLRNLRIRLHFA